MSLLVNVSFRQGAFALVAAFETAGSLTALFGASGSGKTTLVNLIGGILVPDQGRIAAGGRVLADRIQGVFLPPHRRRIGYVFQDARLFPHLTVRQNLRYGRFFAPRAERWAEEGAVVDLLGIGHLLDRRPAGLSGGERSRVAIGRALMASPRLLLMDEPFASLDERRKNEIFPYVERLRDETGVPIVYVSHSVAEVARLATDVVVLDAGRVTATGPAAAVLERLDLLPLDERREGGALIEALYVGPADAHGLGLFRSRGGEWRLAGGPFPPGASVRLRVRARDVMIATERPNGLSANNILAGRVVEVEAAAGPEARVTLDCGGDRLVALVTRLSVEALGVRPGRDLFAVVKSASFGRLGASAPA
ncbi:MAG TPA: molybdenum ABC transporter ATP-binding protein [Mesorhizobium sp.]|jgi:molybdate transport system ATP-binding protein|nr:molybdenum ABC transporter ATP-binding protein [Mesorhizobium sp.]